MPRAAAAAGAFAGMTRGHALLVAPAAALAFRPGGRLARRRVVEMLVVLLVVEGTTVALWAVRNEKKLGHPVPIATNAGLNLLLGNNPNAWGGRADPPGGMPQTGDEVRDERLAVKRARRFMASHPLRVLALLPVKVARLWVPAPAVTYRAELARKWGRPVAVLVLLLAQLAHLVAWWLAGRFAWRAWKRKGARGGRTAVLVVALVLGVWTLGHLPFLGGARYFFPVQFLVWTAAVLAMIAPRSGGSRGAVLDTGVPGS